MAQTLTQLRAFVSVARLGSVQLAAKELFVTQPSVSAAVAALSKELGVELFERNGRGVRITEAGNAYLPYAMRMLGLVAEGQAAVHAVTRSAGDTTRLIAASTASDHLLPALIDAFRQGGGGTVSLSVANRDAILERVAAHDADIGITGPLGPVSRYQNLVSTPFLANELVAVCRAPGGDPFSLTWLLREEGSTIRARTELVLAQAGMGHAETLTLGSAGAVKQALLLGVGASLVARIVVAHELAAQTLVELPIAGTPVQWPMHAVTSADVPMRPAVRQFRDFLLSQPAQDLLTLT